MFSTGEEIDKENIQHLSASSAMTNASTTSKGNATKPTPTMTTTSTALLAKQDIAKRGGGEMFSIPVNDIGVLEKETILYENRHVVKLPILHLGLFQSPLTIDFRNVVIGKAKTLVVQCSIPSTKNSTSENLILKPESSIEEKMILQEN